MRLLAATVALLVLAVLAAAAPAAAPPVTTVLEGGGYVVGDGSRWGVVPTGPSMTVLDGSGPKLTTARVDLGPPCDAQSGTPQAVGSGYVLAVCPVTGAPDQPKLVVYDLRRRRFARVPNDRVLDAQETYGIDGIGSRWIAYATYTHDGIRTDHLLDWHTGRVVSPTRRRDRAVDLDARSASAPLCRGITRPRKPAAGADHFTYRRPSALYETGRPPHVLLRLQRCGRRAVTLTTDWSTAESAMLGEDVVVLHDARDVVWRRLDTDRTTRVAIPAGFGPTGLAVTQVGRFVVLSSWRTSTASFTVAALRWR